MTIQGIKETCLYAENLEEVKQFYHNVLEFPIHSYIPGKHAFFVVGNQMLLVFNPKDSSLKKELPAHYGKGPLHLAFEVAANEYQQIKTQLIDKKIVLTASYSWRPGVESFYFEDPAGHVCEIVPEGLWDK